MNADHLRSILSALKLASTPLVMSHIMLIGLPLQITSSVSVEKMYMLSNESENSLWEKEGKLIFD